MSRTKLRELAKECPCCMGCGLDNPDGNLLCLAHSNSLAHGRGSYHKSKDEFGAYLCFRCHQLVDVGHGLSKEEKREYHFKAWVKTVEWWITNGYIKAC